MIYISNYDRVKSYYHMDHYTKNTSYRGGVSLASQIGFGPQTDNEDVVSFFTVFLITYVFPM